MPTRSLIFVLILAASCGSPDTTAEPELTSILVGGPRDRVDLLFMIDNSPSMAPKQAELRARFPSLLQRFQDLAGGGHPVSYHIGVVTSDLGAQSFTLGGGQCRPGGDGAKLQALGAAAGSSCKPPTGGLAFIEYDQRTGMDNLPPGQDLATTFSCMASVGDRGCGFEQPLESVYQALRNPPSENHDFLRSDALLVVVFVTDEDDCSVPPDGDLLDPTNQGYGALLSYRCTNYGIACGSPSQLMAYASSNGPLDGCHAATPAEGSKLTDVSRYIDFFGKPAAQGGVKVDPADVILATLSAPPAPVESILAVPFPPGPYAGCPGPVDGKQCAVTLQHSCIAPTNPSFFGDPAVRLRQVVSATMKGQNTSICDTSYLNAMQLLGDEMSRDVAATNCLPRAPLDAASPTCEVTDLRPQPDGTTELVSLPACSDGAPPCWRIDARDTCPSGFAFVVDRCLPGTSYSDTNGKVRARCALVAP